MMNLEEIYLNYKKHMMCIADNILNDKHLSEDAVHIAMIKFIENYYKIKNKNINEIKAYLFTITANVAKDLYVENKKEKIKETELLKKRLNEENYFEKTIINKIYIKEITKKLNKNELNLLILRYKHDLTNKNISQILNINEKLVSKKIRKIEKRIEKIVKKGG